MDPDDYPGEDEPFAHEYASIDGIFDVVCCDCDERFDALPGEEGCCPECNSPNTRIR